MKKCKAETLELLLRLAVDVYKGKWRMETLSARNWSSRSLAAERNNNLLRIFQNEGWDADFVFFNQLGSYYYRHRVMYRMQK